MRWRAHQRKTCMRCYRDLPIREFHNDASRDDGRQPVCIECHQELADNYFAARPHFYIFRNWRDNSGAKVEYEEFVSLYLCRLSEAKQKYPNEKSFVISPPRRGAHLSHLKVIPKSHAHSTILFTHRGVVHSCLSLARMYNIHPDTVRRYYRNGQLRHLLRMITKQ